MNSQTDRRDAVPTPIDRRREPRFAIGARVKLQREGDGSQYPAVTLNISTSGVLLRLDNPHAFEVGDQVVCEIELKDAPDGAFAQWGMGRVVRVDEANAGIELQAGVFNLGGDAA